MVLGRQWKLKLTAMTSFQRLRPYQLRLYLLPLRKTPASPFIKTGPETRRTRAPLRQCFSTSNRLLYFLPCNIQGCE